MDNQSQVKNVLNFFFCLCVCLFVFHVAAHHSQPAAGTAALGTGSRAGSKGQEGMLCSGPGCAGHAVKSVTFAVILLGFVVVVLEIPFSFCSIKPV